MIKKTVVYTQNPIELVQNWIELFWEKKKKKTWMKLAYEVGLVWILEGVLKSLKCPFCEKKNVLRFTL